MIRPVPGRVEHDEALYRLLCIGVVLAVLRYEGVVALKEERLGLFKVAELGKAGAQCTLGAGYRQVVRAVEGLIDGQGFPIDGLCFGVFALVEQNATQPAEATGHVVVH